MFPAWRLKIREARIALQAGRPDEAGKILQQESVRDFLPAKRLSEEVAGCLVSRAEQHLVSGDSIASWSDLQQAARLGGCDERVAELRQIQADRGLERVRNLLMTGETKLAAEQIARLEQRRLGGSQRRAWKLIIHLIARAKELSDHGKGSEAVEMLDRALRLLPNHDAELHAMIASRQSQLEQQTVEVRRLSADLHQALAAEAWTEVLLAADALLELAPAHQAAGQARRRAWGAVGMEATRVPSAAQRRRREQVVRGLQSTHAWTASAKVDTKAMREDFGNREIGKRVVAWIDGVGGYLVCMGEEVMLGQPADSTGVEIPILADLSRRHASIRRESEAYVINPIHRVRVDGVELSGPTVLKDGALVELGDSVKLRFRKPHALSTTAVLALESHHKTEPAVDGIVLMSDSCVLGAKPQSHIRCSKWADDLVLFRRDEQLHFRTAASVEVDGETVSSGGVLTGNTRIDGTDFALSIEEI